MDFSNGGGGNNNGWGMTGGGSSRDFSGLQDDSVEARELDKLRGDVQQFSRHVSQIESNVKLIGTSRDNHGLRNRIRTDVDATQLQMREIAAHVKQVSAMNMNGADKKKYHTLRQKLVEDFVRIGKDFMNVSQMAAKKEKAPIPEAVMKKAQSGADLDNQEKQALLEQERKEMAAQLENQRAYIDGVNLQREEEIRQLEQNVAQVNEMFHDLAQIVKDQDVLIDNIDSNISNALENVEEGEKEIDKAAEYQKKSRSKMCCILAICVVILLVLVLAIVIPIVAKKA